MMMMMMMIQLLKQSNLGKLVVVLLTICNILFLVCTFICVFIGDKLIQKFAAVLLIGMATPYQILDWYGGRHTCHTASLVTGRMV